VKRLTELQGFQRVVAPFDGVITARNYDAGALISATSAGMGRELFHIDQTDVLRAFVNVPQGYATEVKIGQEAALVVRNYPETPFKGTVARTAGAVDAATRTMRTEVDVPTPTDGSSPACTARCGSRSSATSRAWSCRPARWCSGRKG